MAFVLSPLRSCRRYHRTTSNAKVSINPFRRLSISECLAIRAGSCLFGFSRSIMCFPFFGVRNKKAPVVKAGAEHNVEEIGSELIRIVTTRFAVVVRQFRWWLANHFVVPFVNLPNDTGVNVVPPQLHHLRGASIGVAFVID
jgi:hypothetical protein